MGIILWVLFQCLDCKLKKRSIAICKRKVNRFLVTEITLSWKTSTFVWKAIQSKERCSDLDLGKQTFDWVSNKRTARGNRGSWTSKPIGWCHGNTFGRDFPCYVYTSLWKIKHPINELYCSLDSSTDQCGWSHHWINWVALLWCCCRDLGCFFL